MNRQHEDLVSAAFVLCLSKRRKAVEYFCYHSRRLLQKGLGVLTPARRGTTSERLQAHWADTLTPAHGQLITSCLSVLARLCSHNRCDRPPRHKMILSPRNLLASTYQSSHVANASGSAYHLTFICGTATLAFLTSLLSRIASGANCLEDKSSSTGNLEKTGV
jgi:hypothetical protein